MYFKVMKWRNNMP